MVDPLFWLGFSLLLVAVSLAAVLIVALPAFLELARAARSAEKLFDTLNRELPPTLEAIRLTGLEVSNLTDEMNEGVQNAGRIVQQLDQSISSVGQQAKQAQIVTHSVFAGFKAAWKSFTQPTPNSRPPVGYSSQPFQSESEVQDVVQADAEESASLSSEVDFNVENTKDDRNSHPYSGNSSDPMAAKPVPVGSNSTVEPWIQEDVDEEEIRSNSIS